MRPKLAVIVCLAGTSNFSAHGAPRWRPASRRRVCSCSAGEDHFDAWVKQHPLPGTTAAAATHRTSTDSKQHGQYVTTRFSWQRTPAVAARCLRHPHLRWEIQGRSLLGTDPLDGSVLLKLQLPRVVAGLFPVLEHALRPSDSPLPRPADAQHDAVLGFLHSLAQHAEHDPGVQRSGSSGSGSVHNTGSLHDRRNSRSGSIHDSGSSAGLLSQDDSCTRGLHTTSDSLQRFAGSDVMSSYGGCGDSSLGPGVTAPSAAPLAGAPFQIGSQLLVLLSADSAALAIFQEGRMVCHRVLTGYTVRRKQGKSQLTYERHGGGAHSAGGSVRAREARRLFQSAAEKLQQWAPEVAACSQLYRGGTLRVWNELHASRSPPAPVDRRDARWREVGLGVRRPRLEDLERVGTVLMQGLLEELRAGEGEGGPVA